jgi:hypothetical protein
MEQLSTGFSDLLFKLHEGIGSKSLESVAQDVEQAPRALVPLWLRACRVPRLSPRSCPSPTKDSGTLRTVNSPLTALVPPRPDECRRARRRICRPATTRSGAAVRVGTAPHVQVNVESSETQTITGTRRGGFPRPRLEFEERSGGVLVSVRAEKSPELCQGLRSRRFSAWPAGYALSGLATRRRTR